MAVRTLGAAGLLIIGFLTVPAAEAVTCPPSNGHVWFVGVVYDSEQREDFILDIDNFEFFLAKLRTVYCIPDAQAKILAMENNFVRNGKTYPAATEAAVKSQLATFATAANQFSDSLLFFFLSSHGNTGASSCPGGNHLPSSFAALKSSGGDNGLLVDCELGASLAAYDADVRMVVSVDCSFCGGFSDSLTAASGTIPDDSLPRSAGVVKANRVVITGCAITTECFGSSGGGVMYKHLKRTITLGLTYCDGFTTPGFPTFQGLDVPVNNNGVFADDGRCTASEWLFGAVQSAYGQADVIGIQQQFRIKYGLSTLAQDIRIF